MIKTIFTAITAVALLCSITFANASQKEGGDGADGMCTYEGKDYSPGAKIKTSDGTEMTCNKDGTWSSNIVRGHGGQIVARFPAGGLKAAR